jgi:tRNA U55 pseudouridine synthase TruB
MQHPEAGSPGEIPVLDGFLALHKPEEWTSNDVVKKVGSTFFLLGLDLGFL